MLPKQLRLPYYKSSEVRKKGKKIETKFLRAFFLPQQENRFLILIPKKLVSLSTKRHRLKRLLDEALRLQKNLSTSGSFVIHIKKPLELKNPKEALALLVELFSKTNA